MSYGIQEGIGELEQKLKAERAIAERFPDAVLDRLCDGNQVWVSESATDHTTDLHIAYVPPTERNSTQTIIVYTYLTVEGMRVFARPGIASGHHLVWLDDLRKKHPEAYKARVETARK